MMEPIGVYTYNLSGNSDDYLFEVFNLLQLAAGQHADDRGFGQEVLLNQGLMWVLYRVRLELDDDINPNKPVQVETFVKSIEGVTSRREFIFFQEGKQIGGGTSVWYCLDSQIRRPSRVPQEFVRLMIPVDKLGTGRQVEKLETLPDLPIASKNITATSLDEDIAGHVNNAAYVKWVVQGLMEFTKNIGRIRGVVVNYVQEGKAGDELTLEVQSNDHKEFLYSFKNQDKNLAICLVKIEVEYNLIQKT